MPVLIKIEFTREEVRMTFADGSVGLFDAADWPLLRDRTWHCRAKTKRRHVQYIVSNEKKSDGIPKSRKAILAHCLIMGQRGVDHRDGNGLDNRRNNLRPASGSQNSQNQAPQRQVGKASKYKGVTFNRTRQRFVARIRAFGKLIHLKQTASETEAALAYDVAAKKYFGTYARTNF